MSPSPLGPRFVELHGPDFQRRLTEVGFGRAQVAATLAVLDELHVRQAAEPRANGVKVHGGVAGKAG